MLTHLKTLGFKAWRSDWEQNQVRLLPNKDPYYCLIMPLNWEIDPKLARC